MEQRSEAFCRRFPNLILYIFLLSAICGLSFMPGGEFHFANGKLLTGTLTSLFMASMLSYLSGLNKWVRRVITTLLALLAFVELFLLVQVKTRLSDRIIMLALQTNPAEAGDFIAQYVLNFKTLVALAGFVVATAICYAVQPRIVSLISRLTAKFSRKLLIGLFIMVNIGSFAGMLIRPIYYIGGYPTLEQVVLAINMYFSSSFDYDHLAKTITTSTDGTLASDADHPARIVWVIGESYNRHHSQLYGYPLPTCPNMALEVADTAKNRDKMPNLLVFSDVITPTSATVEAMTIFYSPHSIDDVLIWEEQPLLPSIMKHSGYYVSLHDNQVTQTLGDLLWDCDNMSFFNYKQISDASLDYRNSSLSNYDLDFCRAESAHIGHSTFNFDIYHLRGQHTPAAKLYPNDEYAKFGISDYDFRTDLDDSQKSVVAHYDNATFYNDAVLAEIFKQVENDDAIVIYHSDHGEEIHDFRNNYGRTLEKPNRQIAQCVYEIPLIVYTTPKFRELHPKLYRRIASAVDRPFSVSDIAHLIMAVAGVESRYFKPERSLIADTCGHRPLPRLIYDSTVDYDRLISGQ